MDVFFGFIADQHVSVFHTTQESMSASEMISVVSQWNRVPLHVTVKFLLTAGLATGIT